MYIFARHVTLRAPSLPPRQAPQLVFQVATITCLCLLYTNPSALLPTFVKRLDLREQIIGHLGIKRTCSGSRGARRDVSSFAQISLDVQNDTNTTS